MTENNFPVIYILGQEINILWQEIILPWHEINFPWQKINFLSQEMNFLWQEINFLWQEINFLSQEWFFLWERIVFLWILGVSHFRDNCAGFTIKISCETLRFRGNLVPRFPVIIPPWFTTWIFSPRAASLKGRPSRQLRRSLLYSRYLAILSPVDFLHREANFCKK